jgi:hypothetical protein
MLCMDLHIVQIIHLLTPPGHCCQVISALSCPVRSKIVSGKIKDGFHGKSLAAIPASIILLPRYKIQAYIIRHGGWCAGNECFS